MLRSKVVRCLNNGFVDVIKRTNTTACSINNRESTSVTKPENWETAKSFDNIPGPKPLPLLGNTWRFVVERDFVKMSSFLRKNYGDVVAMRKIINFGNFVFLFNVRDIEWLLRNEGPYPMRDGFDSAKHYRHELRKDVFGDTLGLLNGHFEQWASFRRVVNPIMMQPRITQQYLPALNEIADEFMLQVRTFKESNPVGEMPADFINEINKWAFESIAAIAFDTRLGCLGPNPTEKSRLAMKYAREFMDLSFELDFKPTGLIHKKFKTSTWKQFIKSQDFFTDLVLKLVEEATNKINNDPNYAQKPEYEKSVFEKLVAKDKKVAIVMSLDMLAAGIETTGKASGAILYFLSKNKDAQTNLRKELMELLPEKDTPVTNHILDEAKYLRATIKESLRIAPIAHSTVRRTTKDMVIGGYQIPSGVLVMMPHIFLSTATDEHFSNPMEFKPERWIRKTKEDVNPFVNLPFGFGARSCIGKRMANMEMEVFIAKMVRNYYLDWQHKDMTFRQELAYGLVDPLKIRLTDV